MNRATLRDHWLQAVAAADVGHAMKELLFYLAATGKVTPRGALTFHRETVAAAFNVVPERISDLMRAARRAGLLERRGGGWNGRTTEYVITFPEGARNYGTFSRWKVDETTAPSGRRNSAPSPRLEPEKGAEPFGTHYARVDNASRERDDNAPDVGDGRVNGVDERSDEKPSAHSRFVADSRPERNTA